MKRERPAPDKEGRAARRKDGRRAVSQHARKVATKEISGLFVPEEGVPPLPEERIEARPARGRGGGSSSSKPTGSISSFARIMRAARSPVRERRVSQAAPRQDFRQRCSVRVTYTGRAVRGHFAAHARYLMRESASNGDAPLGTLGQEPLPEALGRWQASGDKRLWKMIVSPEFGERIRLSEFTNALMSAIERDLHRKLEWAAVEHRNTDHPHVHIVIRSVDSEGREIRFEPDYLKSGIRNHAQDLCTQQLGNRSYGDIATALNREVEQFRFTSLDQRILRELKTGDNELAPHYDRNLGGHRASFPDHPFLRARLQFLARAGVVTDLGNGESLVPMNLDWQLRQMANAADRQRMLAQAGIAISDDRLQQRVTPPREIEDLRGRVLTHVEDDRTQSTVMILEGTDGVVHFIRHDQRIAAARAQGRLALNHFVAFEAGQVHDLGDADAYLSSRQFRGTALPSELASASHAWRGWLGRYHAVLSSVQSAPERGQPVVQREHQEREDFER